MNKMLIATDYDGTLNRNGQIDEFTRKEIDLWRASGRYFGVVTGRGTDFFDTAKENNLPFDYLIVHNGSTVLAQDGSIIYQSLIDPAVLSEIDSLMRRYDDAVIYSVIDGAPLPHYYASFENAERALVVQKELVKALDGKATVLVNGKHINIGNPGTGKAEGVSIILDYFNLAPDAAAVAGDDYNDLDMILKHGGWAVESGKPAVVEKAPHTCESVGALIYSLLEEESK